MNHQRLDGLALGIAIGFAFAVGVFWALTETTETLRNFFSEILTSAVALFGAALAVFGISRQVQSNFEIVNAARLGRLRAAQATLPLVLSNIHLMCEKRISAICQGRKHPNPGERWEMGDLDLATIKECVESAADEERKALTKIILIYQVLVARWEGTSFFAFSSVADKNAGEPGFLDHLNQYGALEDWAELKGFCEGLFSYARSGVFRLDEARVRGIVFRTLNYLHEDGVESEAGYLLKNRASYSEFLERRSRAPHTMLFEDEYWERE